MARLEDLVGDIADEKLRQDIQGEVAALKGRIKFGLVYERHIPEVALVNDPDLINVGSIARPRPEVDKEVNYRVLELKGSKAVINPEGNGKTEEIAVADLFAVLPFGEPVYPTLASIEAISRSTTKPYHVVINGENYHALQLLTHVQARSIDCIYIDPPYNTGATDWKYNNRYVDKNDAYRHSKWLSMMEKRLRLARRLLKDDGVLICTIGEDEINHLGVLLEELFPEASRQLVTICINPGGAGGDDVLSRVEEYAFFCFFGQATPAPTEDDMLVSAIDTDAAHTGARGIRWEWLMRGGNAWYRASRENLCYPIILSPDGTMIEDVGDPYEGEEDERPLEINGRPVAWPVRKDGKLGIWRVEGPTLMNLVKPGYAFVSAQDAKRGTWTIKYLLSGTIEAIASGMIEVTGRGERGEVQVRVSERRGKTAKTIWYRGRHTAGGGRRDAPVELAPG